MKIPLVLKKLFRRRIVLAAAICLLLVVVVALLASVITGYDPNDTAVRERLSVPTASHLLGTDELGRDLFARIAFGGRYSLTIAALTAMGSIVFGTLFGLVAGFFRRLDTPIMRVVDAMMSFPDILLAIAEMEKKYELRCANVFHAGDGNLHPLILFDANDAGQLHRAELFGADILETSVAMGGTVTGEHGVGIEKLNSMCVQFTAAENEQMFGIKRAFDPKGLLNPGKVIPTLNRCAEYGKMLVRGGQIKHPDLPRF